MAGASQAKAGTRLRKSGTVGAWTYPETGKDYEHLTKGLLTEQKTLVENVLGEK